MTDFTNDDSTRSITALKDLRALYAKSLNSAIRKKEPAKIVRSMSRLKSLDREIYEMENTSDQPITMKYFDGF